jgi:hypothetical protein
MGKNSHFFNHIWACPSQVLEFFRSTQALLQALARVGLSAPALHVETQCPQVETQCPQVETQCPHVETQCLASLRAGVRYYPSRKRPNRNSFILAAIPTTTMTPDGKNWVVLAVTLITFLALVFLMIRLERKLNQLANQISDSDE